MSTFSAQGNCACLRSISPAYDFRAYEASKTPKEIFPSAVSRSWPQTLLHAVTQSKAWNTWLHWKPFGIWNIGESAIGWNWLWSWRHNTITLNRVFITKSGRYAARIRTSWRWKHNVLRNARNNPLSTGCFTRHTTILILIAVEILQIVSLTFIA